MELRDRNLLDSAVQEAYLAIPYAFAKLNANAQAAENYELAINSFDTETREPRCVDRRDQRRHDARQAARSATQNDHYGWFWQLRKCRTRRSRVTSITCSPVTISRKA